MANSEVYPEKPSARGLDFLRPEPTELDEMSRIAMEELVYGTFKPGSITTLQAVIERRKRAGRDAVQDAPSSGPA